MNSYMLYGLTHWGRATHICVGKLAIIGSDNGLSPGRHQAIIWTNAGTLLLRSWGTNFSEMFIWNQIFLFKKMHLKMSSGKGHVVYLGLNVSKMSDFIRCRCHNICLILHWIKWDIAMPMLVKLICIWYGGPKMMWALDEYFAANKAILSNTHSICYLFVCHNVHVINMLLHEPYNTDTSP